MAKYIKIPVKALPEMVCQIVKSVDYDIWKDAYNPETAEEPEFVDGNVDALVDVVQSYGEKQ